MTLGVSLSSLQLPHHVHELRLERISHYVLATLQLGFTLAWDGAAGSVYIKLSPEFVGRTCGLCGNFNADVRDDLKTSFGKFKNTLKIIMHFRLGCNNGAIICILFLKKLTGNAPLSGRKRILKNKIPDNPLLHF